MGKIEALKDVDQQLIEAVERIEKNTLSPNKNDIFYLVKRYNKVNTSGYTKREVSVCPDCRRHLWQFWLNVVNQWKKTEQYK